MPVSYHCILSCHGLSYLKLLSYTRKIYPWLKNEVYLELFHAGMSIWWWNHINPRNWFHDWNADVNHDLTRTQSHNHSSSFFSEKVTAIQMNQLSSFALSFCTTSSVLQCALFHMLWCPNELSSSMCLASSTSQFNLLEKTELINCLRPNTNSGA